MAILAVSGILINFIIARYYGAAVLGRFNIIYAIYIIASQFCTFGIHYSVLKHLAAKNRCKQGRSVIIGSGLLIVFILSIIFSALLLFASEFSGKIFGSPIIVVGLSFMTPGLIFFATNKVLLASLNGLRFMKGFALGLSMRYLLMMGFVLVVALSGKHEKWLYWSYLFAEFCLFWILNIILCCSLRHLFLSVSFSWVKEHLMFGCKGFLVGILVELNTRIDIFILGIFVSNQMVGIYSFAAMLAEGLYQFLVVIKNNINPLLARYIAEKKYLQLSYLMRNVRKFMYIFMLLLCFGLIGIYPVIVKVFLAKMIFMQGWILLIFLLLGVYVGSGFLPFGDILTQSGLPEIQTLQNLLVVLTNALLNVIFIYYWGIYGCAIATMLATYIFSLFYLNAFSKKYVQFSLVKLKTV